MNRAEGNPVGRICQQQQHGTAEGGNSVFTSLRFRDRGASFVPSTTWNRASGVASSRWCMLWGIGIPFEAITAKIGALMPPIRSQTFLFPHNPNGIHRSLASWASEPCAYTYN